MISTRRNPPALGPKIETAITTNDRADLQADLAVALSAKAPAAAVSATKTKQPFVADPIFETMTVD